LISVSLSEARHPSFNIIYPIVSTLFLAAYIMGLSPLFRSLSFNIVHTSHPPRVHLLLLFSYLLPSTPAHFGYIYTPYLPYLVIRLRTPSTRLYLIYLHFISSIFYTSVAAISHPPLPTSWMYRPAHFEYITFLNGYTRFPCFQVISPTENFANELAT